MSFYHRRIWRDRMRKQVLHDADWKCTRCGIGLAELAPRKAHVHHRKPLKRAPALGLEPLNLMALCLQCHNAEEAGTMSIAAVDGSPTDPRHPWNIKPLSK
jgi:5-methylcytosine-specific restriction endonuclease McrA